MKIGIIGAGQIGGSLARRLTSLGHEVRVANSRGPETLADLAKETGATAVWAADAAQDADLVIVSIPQKNVVDLAPGIVKTAKDGAPVIETNNYYPRERDGAIAEIEAGTTESRWVADQLGVEVFKVFNNVFWKLILNSGKPDHRRIAVPIAGADGPGKDLVFQLVQELGFDPVDAGSLEESWRQQPGTPIYGARVDVEEAKALLAQASPERPENHRA